MAFDVVNLGFNVDSSNLNKATKGLEGMGKSAVKVRAAMAAVSGIATGVAVKTYFGTADEWTDLSSRVGLAVGDMDKAQDVMKRLANMADRTYTDISLTAEGWLQNSTALKELGLSADESLDFIESFNNAMVVSGAKGQQAESVMNALSKAMGLGKLSGDNLNTILARGGRVAELLAEELGVTVSELRTLGAQGIITGDVIDRAIRGNLEKTRKESDGMQATVGDGFLRIRNAAFQIIGTFDQASGASAKLADKLVEVSEAMITVFENANKADGIATQMSTTFDRIRIAASGLTGGDVDASRAALRDFFIDVQDGANRVTGSVPQVETSIIRLRTVLDSIAERDWASAGAVLGDFLLDALDGATRLVDLGFGAGSSQKVADWVASVVQYLGGLPAQVVQWGADVVAAVGEGLAGMFQAGVDAVVALWDGMKSKMGEVKAWIASQLDMSSQYSIREGSPLDKVRNWMGGGEDTGAQVGAGMVKGMNGSAAAVAAAGANLGETAAQSARDALDIRSPSRVMEEVGEYIAAGMAAGIAANTNAPVAAMRGMADQSLGVMEDFKSGLKSVATALVTDIKSLPQVVGNVLDSIASKLINSGIDTLFASLFGGKGVVGGDLLSTALRAAIPAFANGGVTKDGWSRINERGGELVKLPGGSTVVPHDLSKRAMAANQPAAPQDVHVTVSVDQNGNLQAFVDRRAQAMSGQAVAAYDRAMPSRVQQISANPRRR